jgi:hypothetical protein
MHSVTYAPPAEIFAGTEPVVSVYLNTSGAAGEVASRWRDLRRRLHDNGADWGALDAIERLIEGAHERGPTLVAIAHASGQLYSVSLPDARDDDRAVVGPLPHLVPLLAGTQRLATYAVVLDAELILVRPGLPNLSDVSTPPDALTRLVDEHEPRVVVATGDARTVRMLRDAVPPRVADRLVEVPGQHRDREHALRLADRLVAHRVEADASALLDAYREEMGQGERATCGRTATLAALLIGQVDTLLLCPARTARQSAWFGPRISAVAADPGTLRAAGIPDPIRAPLADVAIRAAIGTGSAVRIVPAGIEPLADGLGATLRFRL